MSFLMAIPSLHKAMARKALLPMSSISVSDARTPASAPEMLPSAMCRAYTPLNLEVAKFSPGRYPIMYMLLSMLLAVLTAASYCPTAVL